MQSPRTEHAAHEAAPAGGAPLQGEDPGLSGVVPFRFHCHRCARCCSGGSGHVWLSESELPQLASQLDMDQASFLARYVRRVPDPESGHLRLSLRESGSGESGGRCILLEGQNECSVYSARPEHCRRFPYSDQVLNDERAFEAARATCPGITVEVDEDLRQQAFRDLEELYAEVEAFIAKASPVCIQRGVCCHFEEAQHELFASALETDYALAQHPDPPRPEGKGRCPYQVGKRCTARAGRPLGCRLYFCDRNTESVLREAHEHFIGRLRAIERERGYPASYARFVELLAARGVGLAREEMEREP